MHYPFKWLSAFRLRTTVFFSRSPKSLGRSQGLCGFTLVELLVAISVIAVLSATGTTVYTNARNSALQAKRLADINAIKKAYELKFDPEVNGGQGGYKPLQGTDFPSEQFPVPPEGGSYFKVGPNVGSDPSLPDTSDANYKTTSFLACASLNGSGSCYEQSATCNCISSSGGTGVVAYVTPTATPTPSNTPTPSPTPTNTPTPSPTPIPGKVGWWKLDEASGTVAVDSSGNGLNGNFGVIPYRSTTDCAPTFSGTCTNVSKDSSGTLITGNPVNIADNQKIEGMANLTVSAWVKYNSGITSGFNLNSGIMGKWNIGPSDNSSSYYLGLYNGTRVDFAVNTTTNGNNAFTGLVSATLPSPINTTNLPWSFVVGVYNQSTGTVKIYLNGTMIQSSTVSTVGSIFGGPTSGTAPLKIGTYNNGATTHRGYIRDVRIYDRALSDTEILNLRNGAQ